MPEGLVKYQSCIGTSSEMLWAMRGAAAKLLNGVAERGSS